MKTRQPLGRALVSAPGWQALPAELRDLVAAELNVGSLEPLAGDLVDVTVKANFRALGKRFGKRTATVAAAVAAADPAGDLVARASGRGGRRDRSSCGRRRADRHRDAARRAGPCRPPSGETVALDLTVTPALRRAGLVRDVVRLVQDARKQGGLEVSDRIELWWQAGDEVAEALREGAGRLAEEVLAVSSSEGHPTADLAPHPVEELGLIFWLRVAGE